MELVSVGETLNSTAADVLDPDEVGDERNGDGDGDDDDGDGGAGGLRGTVVLDKQARKDRWMIMMVTVGMFLAFRNCFVGFMAGCMAWALLEVQGRMETWRNEEASSGETTPLLA